MIATAGLTVLTSDLEAARHFYGTILGVALDDQRGGFSGALGAIELFVEGGARPKRRSRRFMEEAGVLVTVRVTDFDAYVAGVVERGGTLLGGVTEGADGRRYTGLADPDGTMIELAEA